MSRVARYGKAVAREGQGDELAAGDADRRQEPLVNREVGKPGVIWVTELWRTQADLDASIEKIRGSDDVAAAMALVEDWQVIELELLGGKEPTSAHG